MSERPADQNPAPRPRTARVMGITVPVIAGVLALSGGILLATHEAPVSYGWFAYVPLSSTTFALTPWFSSSLHAVGAIVLVLGVGALTFCLVRWVGHRGRSAATRSGHAG